MTKIDCLSGDVFDIRDVIKRFEEIENSTEEDEIDEERQTIQAFLDEVRGAGGDENWRGDWYPVGFIADSYFEDYARELADDIGAVNEKLSWPNNCIDWEEAAKQLQADYSSVEVCGSTYWYR